MLATARFLVPNSIVLEPLTIAAWPSASSTKRTAITRPPQFLTRSGSQGLVKVCVTEGDCGS